MPSHSQPSRLWINWLLGVTAGVAVFGLALVIAPSLTRQGFSLLVYASPQSIDAFGQEPARYISLAHAVLGSVMVGWGTAMFYVTRALFARGSATAWNLIALSACAWFIPDTTYSLLSGYWQNALLNTAFFVLFVVPLWATRGNLRDDA
jgi:hypothetical protein